MRTSTKKSFAPETHSKTELTRVHAKHDDLSPLFHEGEKGSELRSLKTEDDTWLTPEEAAAYMKISVPTLHNLTSNGKIPFYKFGRRNRYLRGELRKLLSAQPRGFRYGN